MSRDEAVKAAAEALHASKDIDCDPNGIRHWFRDPEATADRLITAAWPHIEAAVRAQIAAEIRARADEDGQWIGPTDPDSILRMAARIAEGTS
jgi:hypothetical protein